MDKVFVYGMSVAGENFTDRVKETRRLKLNFDGGINTILISPRRMGKTSLVKRAVSQAKEEFSDIIFVYLDVYECRDEYDFYNKFAESVIQQSSTKVEQWVENAKEFMMRITPKISITGDPNQEFSLSLGITPSTHSPEEILNLPEVIAAKRGKRIVICIDEFQQIGEFRGSLSVQKRLRGVWQHQKYCSYCLFGSKKHLMTNLFQDKRMPFYMFGEMMYLSPIPTDDWIDYIQGRFKSRNKQISKELCARICEVTQNYSSYVQQLAWNVFAETDGTATEEGFADGVSSLLEQCTALFQQQIASLSTYQMNMLRAIASGIHDSYTAKEIIDSYKLGSKSNITRLQESLVEKELIEKRADGLYFADPIFGIWFQNK